MTVVGRFVRGRGGEFAAAVEDLSVAAAVVEPVDVFEGGELDESEVHLVRARLARAMGRDDRDHPEAAGRILVR